MRKHDKCRICILASYQNGGVENFPQTWCDTFKLLDLDCPTTTTASFFLGKVDIFASRHSPAFLKGT